MPQPKIREKIIRGSAWTMLSNIGANLTTFAVLIVLARLLSPDDFGIVAITSVFTGIVTLFQDLGMGAAIIQRKEINDEYLSTSFVVSLAAGIVIAAALVLASPLIASFYGEEVLKPVLMVSAAGFVLSPFVSTHTSILTRRLEFRKITGIHLATQALSGAFSITLAFYGSGVWSLVLGRLLAQPLLIPAVWSITGWRPRPVFVRKCFNDLFGYSSNLLGFNIINYCARNFDNLIIGKYLGAQILGYYSVAYNLMLKPLQLISWSIGKVLFPVFSTIQDDIERTRAVYLKVIRSISLVTFPMMTGLVMVSREFVLTVYGSRWEGAILPLQLLCIVGALQSIGTTGGVIFNSRGRPDLTLKIGSVASFVTVGAFLMGIRWGLIGLIIAYIAVSIPIFITGQFFANRLIGLSMAEFARALFPAGVCSAAMFCVLFGFRLLNASSLHLDISSTLALFVLLGIITYGFFAVMVLKVPEAAEAIEMVKKRF
ncbi:MAG: MOP flippase family protein [Deltaproteobacteria bacterium]|nr:MOP flippase family protein [Deltaproteobacteria bacterium]